MTCQHRWVDIEPDGVAILTPGGDTHRQWMQCKRCGLIDWDGHLETRQRCSICTGRGWVLDEDS